MNNLLLWLSGILLIVLCALFAVPPMIDWNQYRGVFEEEVSRFLGREVRVGGDVQLRILPMPYVSFGKVRIADAPGIAGSFIRSDRFTLWLAVPPLLRGIIEARKIEIEKPSLRLRLDGKGGGNWQTVKLSEADLPFVPRQIALQSVNIVDGDIRIENATGEPVYSLDAIAGELSAEALAGPYRFAGTIGAGPAQREVRLSTSAPEADGGVRLKAVVRSEQTSSHVAIDGVVRSLDANPQFTGSLRARMTVDSVLGDDVPAATASSGGGEPQVRVFDLTGTLTANAELAQLGELGVAFDSAGRPQRLEGAVQATWQKGLAVEGRLASKWLDLDAIFGLGKGASPLEAIKRLAARNTKNQSQGEALFELSIDQANLGGTSVGPLLARVGRKAGTARIDRLQVQLPGQTRLSADGDISFAAAGAGFDGHVILHGRNFKRFAQWAQLPLPTISGRASGPFAYDADMKVSPAGVVVDDLVAELGGGSIKGDLSLDRSGTPELSVDLELAKLDVSDVGVRILHDENLDAFLGRTSNVKFVLGSFVRGLADTVIKARVRGTDVSEGTRKLRSFDIAVERTPKTLKVERGRVAFDTGLEIDISGRLAHGAGPMSGQLGGVVGAVSAAGARELMSFLAERTGLKGVPDAGLPWASGHAVYPLRLAFTSRFGGDPKVPASLVADGEVRGDRVRVTMESGGGVADWRTKSLRVAAEISGKNARETARWLRAAEASVGRMAGDEGAVPIELRLEAAGIPSKSMLATLSIDSAPLGVVLTTDARLSADDRLTFAGRARVNSADLSLAANVFLPELVPFAEALPMTGTVDIDRLETAWRIQPRAVQFGVRPLSGEFTVHDPSAPSGRRRVDGTLKLKYASAGVLASPLMSAASDRSSAEAREGDQRGGDAARLAEFWSDRAFDLSNVDGFDGTIKLNVDQLELAEGLVAKDAVVTIGLGPRGVTISDFRGGVAGGQISGRANFAVAAAGIEFSGNVKLAGVDVSQFASAELAGRLAGKLDGELDAKGHAQSPRALIAGLRGKGRLALKSATVPGLGPAALSEIAKKVVGGEADPTKVGEVIQAAVETDAIKLPQVVQADLSVRDGALRVGVIRIASDGRRAENRTTVDLLRLAADSEWRVWPMLERGAAAQPPKPLPELQFVYAGALVAFASTEAQIQAGALQRELTVRRMEADVLRLEQLRREDDARAKAEAERLRRLEIEQQKAIELERLRREQSAPAPVPEPLAPGKRSSATQPPDSGQGQAGVAQPVPVPARSNSSWPTQTVPSATQGEGAAPPLSQAPPKPSARRSKPKPPTWNSRKMFDPVQSGGR